MDEERKQRIAPPSSGDDALLAEMLAPPPLEDAQASYEFWRRRARNPPVHLP